MLVVFTDGSCIDNGRPHAKGAYARVSPDHPSHNSGIPLPADEIQTNNRAEYRALLHALTQADTIDPSRIGSLRVYTDSMLMINSFSKWIAGWKRKGWKTAGGTPVKNLDLVREIDEKMQLRAVTFTHVRAHTNGTGYEAYYNDQVDRLARSSIA